MDLIRTSFPELNQKQIEQFRQMGKLYRDWNARINLISRRDMDHFYERHVLHSLSIAKFFSFKPGQKVLDVGTGGGFPGMPLAVMFPAASFTLADSISKKIRACQAIQQSLGLDNVECHNGRAEQMKGRYDYITSRAVTALPRFLKLTGHLLKPENGGLIYLKGGDFEQELAAIPSKPEIIAIRDSIEGLFFESKKIIWLPAGQINNRAKAS
jgi:16S rRNA (guanine527-N7)-methyltransferase